MDTSVTPARRLHIRIGVPETVAIEPPFSMYRAGSEMYEAPGTEKVEQMANGSWHLRQIFNQEATDTQSYIIEKANWQTVPSIDEYKSYRANTDLSGISLADGQAADGGKVMVRRITASGTWAEELTDDQNAFPRPNFASNTPVTRMGVMTANPLKANQWLQLRFAVPGIAIQPTDTVWRVYFGGPTGPDDRGMYCLIFYGNGIAELIEGHLVQGALEWGRTRLGIPVDASASWRYADTAQVAGFTHTIRILPHVFGPNNCTIEFKSGTSDTGGRSGTVLSSGYHEGKALPNTFIYRCSHSIPGQAKRTQATGPGGLRFDIKQDIRLTFQIAFVRVYTEGKLVDGGFGLPFYVTAANPLTLAWRANVPDSCTFTGRLFAADTHTELSQIESGTNYRTYAPVAGLQLYYARFEFAGPGSDSPELLSYTVIRNGILGTTNPTLIDLTTLRAVAPSLPQTVLVSAQFSGGEADPSHETGHIEIEDMANNLPTLLNQVSQRVQCVTQFDLDDPTKTITLLDGYNERTSAKRKGFQGGQWPKAPWQRFSCEFMGMWVRLMEARAPVRISLLFDPNSDTANPVPYKVTDIIRAFLGYAGFSPSQIDVPDSPIRFFASEGADALVVSPLESIGPLVLRWLYDYLGWWLLWEGNMKGGGGWRARPPAPTRAQGGYRNLWSFTTQGPPGTQKLVHTPVSYPNTGGNWLGTDQAIGQTFVRKNTLETWIQKPEATAVFVTSTGNLTQEQKTEFVHHSFIANLGAIYDPTDRDYIGRLVYVVVVDNTLQSDEACNFLALRIYDVACHSIPMAGWDSPLVFVNDTQDLIGDPNHPFVGQQCVPAGYGRPLRYQDPVLLNGEQYLVRNANPYLLRSKDSMQFMRVEAEIPRI